MVIRDFLISSSLAAPVNATGWKFTPRITDILSGSKADDIANLVIITAFDDGRDENNTEPDLL